MANPPYSGLVLIVRETSDGLSFRVWTWEDMIADNLADVPPPPAATQIVGMEIPPGIDFASALTQTLPKPTRHRAQSVATRTLAASRFAVLLTQTFPDTLA